MNFAVRPVTFVLAVLITAGGPVPCNRVEAGPAMVRPPMRLAKNSAVSLQQAAARVKRKTGGRILGAETITRKGRRVHRIKVLRPNGNIKVVFIDAE